MLKDKQKEIILGFAENDMNMEATGRALYMTSGNVYYHLRRVEEKTGLNPTCFYDLVELVDMVKGESNK